MKATTTPYSYYSILYYGCMDIARRRYGLTLYEFYAKYFDKLVLTNFEKVLDFLVENKKVDRDKAEFLKLEMLREGAKLYHAGAEYGHIDIFKNLTALSEEDICFILNYFIAKNIGCIERSEIRTIYDKMLDDDDFMLDIAYHYPATFKVDFTGSTPIILDEANFAKDTWNKIYIGRGDFAGNEIAETIYLLEEVNTDEISQVAIKRLKALLTKELDIAF